MAKASANETKIISHPVLQCPGMKGWFVFPLSINLSPSAEPAGDRQAQLTVKGHSFWDQDMASRTTTTRQVSGLTGTTREQHANAGANRPARGSGDWDDGQITILQKGGKRLSVLHQQSRQASTAHGGCSETRYDFSGKPMNAKPWGTEEQRLMLKDEESPRSPGSFPSSADSAEQMGYLHQIASNWGQSPSPAVDPWSAE